MGRSARPTGNCGNSGPPLPTQCTQIGDTECIFSNVTKIGNTTIVFNVLLNNEHHI